MKHYNIQNYIRYKNDLEATLKRVNKKEYHEYTRDELIVVFLPLVENIARKFSTTQQASGVLSINDLIQIGAEGLIKGKQAFIAMSSGGIYSEGALQDSDFVSPYLEKILNFIGIEDVTTYRVEGVAIPGIKEEALEKAMEAVEL